MVVDLPTHRAHAEENMERPKTSFTTRPPNLDGADHKPEDHACQRESEGGDIAVDDDMGFSVCRVGFGRAMVSDRRHRGSNTRLEVLCRRVGASWYLGGGWKMIWTGRIVIQSFLRSNLYIARPHRLDNDA